MLGMQKLLSSFIYVDAPLQCALFYKTLPLKYKKTVWVFMKDREILEKQIRV